jgi:hypothetical protein
MKHEMQHQEDPGNNHTAGRENVSQLSEPWDGCRIVPALRVENRFWQKEVSRAEVAVWVLSMIRNFRIYTNRFNAH